MSGSADGSVGVWSYPEGTRQHVIDSGSTRVLSLALAADGSTLVSGLSRPDSVKVWDASSGAMLQKLGGQEEGGSPVAVAITPDASLVLSASPDGVVRVWDRVSSTLKYKLTGNTVIMLSNINSQVVTTAHINHIWFPSCVTLEG